MTDLRYKPPSRQGSQKQLDIAEHQPKRRQSIFAVFSSSSSHAPEQKAIVVPVAKPAPTLSLHETLLSLATVAPHSTVCAEVAKLSEAIEANPNKTEAAKTVERLELLIDKFFGSSEGKRVRNLFRLTLCARSGKEKRGRRAFTVECTCPAQEQTPPARPRGSSNVTGDSPFGSTGHGIRPELLNHASSSGRKEGKRMSIFGFNWRSKKDDAKLDDKPPDPGEQKAAVKQATSCLLLLYRTLISQHMLDCLVRVLQAHAAAAAASARHAQSKDHANAHASHPRSGSSTPVSRSRAGSISAPSGAAAAGGAALSGQTSAAVTDSNVASVPAASAPAAAASSATDAALGRPAELKHSRSSSYLPSLHSVPEAASPASPASPPLPTASLSPQLQSIEESSSGGDSSSPAPAPTQSEAAPIDVAAKPVEAALNPDAIVVEVAATNAVAETDVKHVAVEPVPADPLRKEAAPTPAVVEPAIVEPLPRFQPPAPSPKLKPVPATSLLSFNSDESTLASVQYLSTLSLSGEVAQALRDRAATNGATSPSLSASPLFPISIAFGRKKRSKGASSSKHQRSLTASVPKLTFTPLSISEFEDEGDERRPSANANANANGNATTASASGATTAKRRHSHHRLSSIGTTEPLEQFFTYAPVTSVADTLYDDDRGASLSVQAVDARQAQQQPQPQSQAQSQLQSQQKAAGTPQSSQRRIIEASLAMMALANKSEPTPASPNGLSPEHKADRLSLSVSVGPSVSAGFASNGALSSSAGSLASSAMGAISASASNSTSSAGESKRATASVAVGATTSAAPASSLDSASIAALPRLPPSTASSSKLVTAASNSSTGAVSLAQLLGNVDPSSMKIRSRPKARINLPMGAAKPSTAAAVPAAAPVAVAVTESSAASTPAIVVAAAAPAQRPMTAAATPAAAMVQPAAVQLAGDSKTAASNGVAPPSQSAAVAAVVASRPPALIVRSDSQSSMSSASSALPSPVSVSVADSSNNPSSPGLGLGGAPGVASPAAAAARSPLSSIGGAAPQQPIASAAAARSSVVSPLSVSSVSSVASSVSSGASAASSPTVQSDPLAASVPAPAAATLAPEPQQQQRTSQIAVVASPSSSLNRFDDDPNEQKKPGVLTEEEKWLHLASEWAIKLVWQCEAILKQGLFGGCPNCSQETDFGRWWETDMTCKAVETAAKAPLSQMVMYSLFEVLIGDVTLPTVRHVQLETNMLNRDLSVVKLFHEPGVLASLLMSISRTGFEFCKIGLEYLNLLVIQKPANASFFLSEKGWQKWFVDLLMGHDFASKQASTQDKDVILKLSLNVIACIHYHHFSTHQSSEEIDPAIKDPVPNMSSLMMESIDLLEELAGWQSETVLTLRVMFCSLLNKIRTTTTLLRAMKSNLHHPSWAALLQMLVIIEHFTFFAAVPPLPTMPPTPTARGLVGAGAAGSAGGVAAMAGAPHRRKPRMHSQHFGVHLSKDGQCEDLILVDKVVELLDNVKLSEASVVNGTPADKDRFRKLQKRLAEHVAFFKEVQAFFGLQDQGADQSGAVDQKLEEQKLEHLHRLCDMLDKRQNDVHSRNLVRAALNHVGQTVHRKRRFRSIFRSLSSISQQQQELRSLMNSLPIYRFHAKSYLTSVRRAFESRQAAREYFERAKKRWLEQNKDAAADSKDGSTADGVPAATTTAPADSAAHEEMSPTSPAASTGSLVKSGSSGALNPQTKRGGRNPKYATLSNPLKPLPELERMAGTVGFGRLEFGLQCHYCRLGQPPRHEQIVKQMGADAQQSRKSAMQVAGGPAVDSALTTPAAMFVYEFAGEPVCNVHFRMMACKCFRCNQPLLEGEQYVVLGRRLESKRQSGNAASASSDGTPRSAPGSGNRWQGDDEDSARGEEEEEEGPPKFIHASCVSCAQCAAPFQVDERLQAGSAFLGVFEHDGDLFCSSDYQLYFGSHPTPTLPLTGMQGLFPSTHPSHAAPRLSNAQPPSHASSTASTASASTSVSASSGATRAGSHLALPGAGVAIAPRRSFSEPVQLAPAAAQTTAQAASAAPAAPAADDPNSRRSSRGFHRPPSLTLASSTLSSMGLVPSASAPAGLTAANANANAAAASSAATSAQAKQSSQSGAAAIAAPALAASDAPAKQFSNSLQLESPAPSRLSLSASSSRRGSGAITFPLGKVAEAEENQDEAEVAGTLQIDARQVNFVVGRAADGKQLDSSSAPSSSGKKRRSKSKRAAGVLKLSGDSSIKGKLPSGA